jgi:tetratricopeptide (TPR) repeat protein
MIYTFYSYKGGVGRSMALANVAEIMYRRGLKVLVIDFDLEAPGLERYFDVSHAVNSADDVERKRGLIDLLVSYNALRELLRPKTRSREVSPMNVSVATARQSTEKADDPQLIDNPSGNGKNQLEENFSEPPFPVEPLTNFIHQVYARNDEGGEIYILPAGLRACSVVQDDGNTTSCNKENANQEEFARYAERVRAFPWNDFYTMWDGQRFFEWFRKEAENFADVILIDSRTGVTEMSGICTYHLADIVVMFSAPNKQNLNGTKKIADSLIKPGFINEGRKGRDLSLLFVPSRIDLNEKVELDDFARLFKETFNYLLPRALTFETNVFVDLKVPYVPFYSFREEVAVRDIESPIAIEMIKVYERLCLTMAKLARPEDKLREKYEPQRLSEGNTAEQQNRFAEAAFSELKADEQQAARRVLMRMVRLSPREEGGADAGVRVSIGEFDDGTMRIVTRLAEVGLVVIDKDEVTGTRIAQLSRETLINDWERFRNWLDKDRGFLIWRQRIKTNIDQWNNSKRERAALLSGNSLSEAEYWLKIREQELTDTENLYIVSSARRRIRSLITNIVALGLIVIFLIGLGIFQWRAYKARELETQQREVEKIKALAASYLSSGDKSLQNDDFTSAIDSYSQAIKLRPDDAEALNKRGTAYSMIADYDKAFYDLSRALELKRDYAEAYTNRGLVYTKKNEWDRAIVDFDEAIRIKPDYAEAYYYRGNVYSLTGDSNQALNNYNRAIILNHDDYPEAYLQRGLIHKKDFEKNKTDANSKEQAISDFTQAISLTNIPALRTESEQNLLQLAGASENPDPQPPQVFLHYNDPSDENVVASIVDALRSSSMRVQGMQPGDSYTTGDIRYYYPEDKKNAGKVQEIVSESLKAQNRELKLKLRFLGGTYYKNVQRGSIEVWIPPLSASLQLSDREEKPTERDSAKAVGRSRRAIKH